MSVEALWTARFGDVSSPGTWENGGVVVLETGRIYGGDGGTYYIGTYEIDRGSFTGKFKSVTFDPRYRSAFGELGPEVDVVAVGTMEGDVMKGTLSSPAAPGLKIGFDLTKREELP